MINWNSILTLILKLHEIKYIIIIIIILINHIEKFAFRICNAVHFKVDLLQTRIYLYENHFFTTSSGWSRFFKFLISLYRDIDPFWQFYYYVFHKVISHYSKSDYIYIPSYKCVIMIKFLYNFLWIKKSIIYYYYTYFYYIYFCWWFIMNNWLLNYVFYLCKYSIFLLIIWYKCTCVY